MAKSVAAQLGDALETSWPAIRGCFSQNRAGPQSIAAKAQPARYIRSSATNCGDYAISSANNQPGSQFIFVGERGPVSVA
jgi:hypothetical protein